MIQNKIAKDTVVELGQSLNAVLETSHQAVKSWIDKHKSTVSIWSHTPEIRQAATTLLAISHKQPELRASNVQAQLRSWFQPLQQATGYLGYFIIGPDNINLASSRDQNIGVENLLIKQKQFLRLVWGGETAISLPEKSDVPLPDSEGQLREGLPSMFVGSPILNEAGEVIAIFTLRINPEKDFTTLLQKGRIGDTGETYAFDREGRLISNSRFDDQLRDMGLISAEERGILNIELRDPGVNLLHVEISDVSRVQLPLTQMAASAITGKSASNLAGYRDYRGVTVVGAWLWDNRLGFGIAIELDKQEAYQTLRTTQNVILTLTFLIILLLTGMMIIFVFYHQRRQAQAALYKSEKLHRHLFENVGVGIVRLDLQSGQILQANNYFCRFVGYEQDELRQMRPQDITHPDDVNESQVYLKQEANDSLDSFKLEKRYICKNGSIRWGYLNSSLIREQNGNIIAAIAAITDITERKLAEEALQKSEESFRMLVEQSPIGIRIAVNGRIRYVNPAYLRMFGYNKETNLAGASLLDNIAAECQEEISDRIARRFSGEDEPNRYETTGIKLDGSKFPFEAEAFLLELPDGQATVVFLSDLSERKQAEEALQRSEVLELLSTGAPLNEILTALVINAEKHNTETLCSVLLLDADGKHLLHGAAPSLPYYYNEAIDGIEIGPDVGCCGAAAYSGDQVIAKDIRSHLNWVNARKLTERAGLRACWSEPIISTGGVVLGTFAIYYREPRAPMQADLDFIQDSARLAGIAIERKQAEAALRNNEQQLRLITDNIPAFVAYIDSELHFRFNNKKYEYWFGMSQDELRGKHVRDVLGETSYQIQKERYAKVLSGIPVEFEYSLQFIDNKEHYISGSFIPDISDDGVTKGFFALAIDITERKQGEHALTESEGRFRAIIENASVGMAVIDSNTGRFVRVNNKYCDIVGYTEAEMLITTFQNITYPDDLEADLANMKMLMDGELSEFTMEKRYYRKDASIVWVNLAVIPMPEDKEGISYHIAIIEDISERKRVEEALRESEAKLRRAQSVAHVGSWELDISNSKLLWSDETYRIFSIPRTEVLTHQKFIEHVHPDDVAHLNKAWETALAGQEYDEEHRIVVDGKIRWVHEKSYFEFDKEGNAVRALGTVQDITERKQTEEQTRQHQADLAHMARINTMGELATGIAHELNQPLSAINTYAAVSQKLLKSDINQQQKLSEVLEAIGAQAMRASEIIRRLRQFVKKQTPQKTMVVLNKLVQEVLTFTEQEIKKKNVHLQLELADRLPEVCADAIQIEQVLVNLIHNSLEAMELTTTNNRQLTIRTYLNQNGLAQVEVTDTGPGIDGETLSHIFESFVTTKGTKGMGIGLSISSSIIGGHGGHLWAKSEPGKGASFFFTLPLNNSC